MEITRDIQAMIDWCEANNRPDWSAVIKGMLTAHDNQGFFDTLRLGFEAGRLFQHKNPNEPIDVPIANSSVSPQP